VHVFYVIRAGYAEEGEHALPKVCSLRHLVLEGAVNLKMFKSVSVAIFKVFFKKIY